MRKHFLIAALFAVMAFSISVPQITRAATGQTYNGNNEDGDNADSSDETESDGDLLVPELNLNGTDTAADGTGGTADSAADASGAAVTAEPSNGSYESSGTAVSAPIQAIPSTWSVTYPERGMHEIAYTMPDGGSGYVYVPDAVINNPDTKVPLVLDMCSTGGDPRDDAKDCGWVDKARDINFIVIAPVYDNSETYTQTAYMAETVQYISQFYPVDKTRVYSTGFSNGGGTSVALTRDYPQLFAAISAMGWMVDMPDKDNVYAGYDMPFQVIQGTMEYAYMDSDDTYKVMPDEQYGLRSLFLYNEMIDKDFEPDYSETPYWGYKPEDSHTVIPDGTKWTVSNYYKSGYKNPFAQLILITNATHEPHYSEASFAWDFFKKFVRNEDGTITETE